MGLFDRKNCSVCGGKIGIIGSKNLKDGQICKSCIKKLSPWFDEYEVTGLEEIRKQLKLREDNKNLLPGFHATYKKNGAYLVRILVDEKNQQFMVTEAFDDEIYKDNPDVISFDQIVSCDLDIDEDHEEIMDCDDEGNDISYDPPRYDFSYGFKLRIILDHPYLHEIVMELNEDTVEFEGSDSLDGEEFDPYTNEEFASYVEMADEIMEVLGMEEEAEEEDEEEAYEEEAYEEDEDVEVFEDEEGKKIKVAICPWCGSRSRVTYNGRCENCGGDLEI